LLARLLLGWPLLQPWEQQLVAEEHPRQPLGGPRSMKKMLQEVGNLAAEPKLLQIGMVLVQQGKPFPC
jgi:hypothetical protein